MFKSKECLFLKETLGTLAAVLSESSPPDIITCFKLFSLSLSLSHMHDPELII